jgi:hydroxymethylbilane synthase
MGAAAVVRGTTLHLRAVVLSPDGRQRLEAERTGPATDAEAVGQEVARTLLDAGAARLLG